MIDMALSASIRLYVDEDGEQSMDEPNCSPPQLVLWWSTDRVRRMESVGCTPVASKPSPAPTASMLADFRFIAGRLLAVLWRCSDFRAPEPTRVRRALPGLPLSMSTLMLLKAAMEFRRGQPCDPMEEQALPMLSALRAIGSSLIGCMSSSNRASDIAGSTGCSGCRLMQRSTSWMTSWACRPGRLSLCRAVI